MSKLDIAYELPRLDAKDRNFYDDLSEEEKKKFSNFLMIRWGSSVQGSKALQEFYLISTNERLNKNWYACSKHPQLQWLMATSVSPGMGTQRHNWIGMKKKEPTGIKKLGKKLISANIKGKFFKGAFCSGCCAIR